MSWIPDFEIGICNAWIFMIWLIIIPVTSTFLIKQKEVLKRLSTSAPMKFEKTSNILSMVVLIVGFIYSIFLPLLGMSIIRCLFVPSIRNMIGLQITRTLRLTLFVSMIDTSQSPRTLYILSDFVFMT